MAHILVVDDEPEVAKALADLLSHHGFTPLRAGSGEEALDLLAQLPVDVVILDVWLPGLNGFETCARIRERHGASLPVVLLTAYGDPEALRRGQEAGADDFLHKPPDTQSLVLKLRGFLRLKALRDEAERSREELARRARDLALLHEIGRDWSLIAVAEDFNRMVTQRLAALIGAPLCMIVLYDPQTRLLEAALPVHGLPDAEAVKLRYPVLPEYRELWDFRSGRPYVSNRARSDPRLIQDMVQAAGAESVLLVPMLSEGRVLAILVACNKPGGFSDADAQLVSIFAGPAATFLRSRQIFAEQRRHGSGLERLADLVGAMSAATERSRLLELAVGRVQHDLHFHRVAFLAPDADGRLALVLEAGAGGPREDPAEREVLHWALGGSKPLEAPLRDGLSELAIPVRAGDQALGVLEVFKATGSAFDDEEVNLLVAIAGQLAVGLQRAESAGRTARLARQMATLYDLGLEITALRDLKRLFERATEEAGRLIGADHASAFRLEPASSTLHLYAAWAREPGRESRSEPVFRLGEGVAGRVALDWVPALVNDSSQDLDFVPRGNPIARLLCVPLTYYDRARDTIVTFGVMNATRAPGAPPFTRDDLSYLMRFAGQLSIGVANATAFESERERSAQLALVNTLLKEIAGNVARERVFETAARRIREAFGYSFVLVVVPDRDEGVNRVAYATGERPMPESWRSYPLHAGITGRVLREKRTVVLPDVSADPDYVAMFDSVRSEAMVPILSGDEVVALLDVQSESPRAMDGGQIITLETLADGIGIILRNAELFRALEDTNARLVEMDRMKSEIVNIVAHDFRAPLAGVLGHAELIEWRPEVAPPQRVEQAQAIIRAATHMSNLVDKTLKTMRLDTGHFPFDFGLTDLAAVAREVASRVPVGAPHSLVCELPEDPVPCWADPDRLAEVLENLLSNAVKYSPAGGEVRLSLRREGEQATLGVSDRGIGIAAQELARLFRPFSRVRSPETAGIEGSGLGLYICDRIVRAHGGRLWAESMPDGGTLFQCTLPIFGAAAQSRGPLVLVGAADASTRREVRRVAQELGYSVQEAEDGVEALEAAFRLVPAAVVLDRVLPRLGAEQVAERLRESPATAGVPLISLATSADPAGGAGLFRAQVDKPLSRATLLAAFEAALGVGRARPSV